MSPDRPFLVAETPRGGRWNSCLIVAEGSGIDPVFAAYYLEAARREASGADYLAVSREVTQPTTGRVGRETLVLAGIAERELNPTRREEVVKAMEGLLMKDLDELIRADPWRDRPQSSLIEHPDVSSWAEAFRDLPRSGLRYPVEKRRRGSPKGTRLTKTQSVALRLGTALLLLLVVSLKLIRFGHDPAITNRDLLAAYDSLHIAPPGDADKDRSSPGYTRMLLRQLDSVLEVWLVLPEKRVATPHDSEEHLRKLLNDLDGCASKPGESGQTPRNRGLVDLIRDPGLLHKVRKLGPALGSQDRAYGIFDADRLKEAKARLPGRDVGRFRILAQEVCQLGQAVKALDKETAQAVPRPQSNGPGGDAPPATPGHSTSPKPTPPVPPVEGKHGDPLGPSKRSADAPWNFYTPDDLGTMEFIEQLWSVTRDSLHPKDLSKVKNPLEVLRGSMGPVVGTQLPGSTKLEGVASIKEEIEIIKKLDKNPYLIFDSGHKNSFSELLEFANKLEDYLQPYHEAGPPKPQ